MNIWQFASDSPWLAFFLLLLITELIFRCWNRTLRHLNIKAKGWPPEHLDADGDFEKDEEH
jgi:hypothetical protein